MKGGYEEYFALSSRYVKDLDWTRISSQDVMHTTLLGPALHLGYYSVHGFIRVDQLFTRDELNAEVKLYKGPPGFCIPEFGSYVEKGAAGNLPYTDGKLHFNAAPARQWIEHSIFILENLFRRKVTNRPGPPATASMPTPGPTISQLPTRPHWPRARLDTRPIRGG